jgi:hypothetical protein
VRFLFLVVLAICARDARKELDKRYGEEFSAKVKWENYTGIKPWLRKAGVQEGDRIIALPGGEQFALYMMNQPGWNNYFDYGLAPGNSYSYNSDSAGIPRSIREGARFLTVYGVNELFSLPFLRNYTHHLAGIYKNIWIFSLTGNYEDRNFSLDLGPLKDTSLCKLERADLPGECFLSEDGMRRFSNLQSRSSDYSFSGLWSARLNSDQPYGLTTTFDTVYAGEYFEVSAWTRSEGEPAGSIVASDRESKLFYYAAGIEKERKNGWRKITCSFTVPFSMNGKPLIIYLYNAVQAPLYCDDFLIRRYTSPLTNLHPPFWVK